MCDRVAIINKGNINAIDSPELGLSLEDVFIGLTGSQRGEGIHATR